MSKRPRKRSRRWLLPRDGAGCSLVAWLLVQFVIVPRVVRTKVEAAPRGLGMRSPEFEVRAPGSGARSGNGPRRLIALIGDVSIRYGRSTSSSGWIETITLRGAELAARLRDGQLDLDPSPPRTATATPTPLRRLTCRSRSSCSSRRRCGSTGRARRVAADQRRADEPRPRRDARRRAELRRRLADRVRRHDRPGDGEQTLEVTAADEPRVAPVDRPAAMLGDHAARCAGRPGRRRLAIPRPPRQPDGRARRSIPATRGSRRRSAATASPPRAA